MKRGVLSSWTMRKPAPAFSAETKAEVDYLLARLAKHDPRARI
jgi:4-hydroxy-tetrahydrodipicolinate synthase